jgi:hypothetical protein
MKITLFLGNFSKIFISGSILLYIVFIFTHQNSKTIILPQKLPPVVQKTELKPKPVSQEIDSKQATIKPITIPKPIEPRYIYIVEMKSGGRMKVKHVTVDKNIVTLWVEDGYSIKISKNDILSVNKQRL